MTDQYKLVVFDVNGVLTDRHTLIDLAGYTGNRSEVEYLINMHTSGQMPMSKALSEVYKLMVGIKRKDTDDYARTLPLTKGIEKMTKTFVDKGIVLGIITSGFRVTMEEINKRLGNPFKYIIANELFFDKDDVSTGAAQTNLIENNSKVQRMYDLIKKEGIQTHECAAVGDSMGDSEMLSAAGLGIAFNPNPALESYAKEHNLTVVKELDLTRIIPIILT